MSYKDKLEGFNSTEKYAEELRVLHRLIGSPDGKVLDYGCGTGYAVEYLRDQGLNVHGYDAVQYTDFEYHPAIGEWECVYFMHSFAHINGIKEVLQVLDTKRVVVITPNREWIELQEDCSYAPDLTVIHHYSKDEIRELFISCGFEVIMAQFGKEINGQCERLCVIASRLLSVLVSSSHFLV